MVSYIFFHHFFLWCLSLKRGVGKKMCSLSLFGGAKVFQRQHERVGPKWVGKGLEISFFLGMGRCRDTCCRIQNLFAFQLSTNLLRKVEPSPITLCYFFFVH